MWLDSPQLSREERGKELLFPIFLSSKWSQIEIVIRSQEDIDAAPVGRVRVKDVLAMVQEDAQPRHLAFIIGDAEVIVEVSHIRGEPGNRPMHALFVGFKLGQWST